MAEGNKVGLLQPLPQLGCKCMASGRLSVLFTELGKYINLQDISHTLLENNFNSNNKC